MRTICFILGLLTGPVLASAAPAPAVPAPAPAAGSGEIIAYLEGKPIYLSQIEAPLIDAYGLNVLINVAKLELAKQNAQRQGITLSTEDIALERQELLKQMLPDADPKDYPNLLEQFLAQQRLSHQEFDMLVETRAYLRKMALQDPLIKKGITDDSLRAAFGELYGETAVVEHIQCQNLQEIGEARRRLDAGESFEQVVRELSRNAETRLHDGELPPFSMSTPGLSQGFKQVAFSLKEGEISDPVQSEGSYHLIKLIKKNEPKAVKFEDVKESVRKTLIDRAVQQIQRIYTTQLTQQAVALLKIENPVLKKQLEDKLEQARATVRDRDKLRQQIEKNSEGAAAGATAPTTEPAAGAIPSTRP